MANLSIQMPPYYGGNPTTQYFPSPQGNIYMVNNSSEIGNIPTGPNLSAILCLPEGMLHLKTIQNGSPMILSYKLMSPDSTPATTPVQNVATAPSTAAVPNSAPTEPAPKEDFTKRFEDYEERLAALERRLQQKEETTKESNTKKEAKEKWQF